jgi:membrane-associated phospholipid phosphatase
VLQNQRRGLAVATALLGTAAVIGVLVAVPATLRIVQNVDDVVWRLAGRVRNGPTTALAKLLSVLGGVLVNWTLRVAAAVVLAVRRRWLQLTAFALAVLSSEALIGPLKAAYARPRPTGSLIATSGASFPSGHAIAGAVTAVGLVVVLLPPGGARWRWEVRAVIFALVMALSRVYLRAHWLSDAVAGGLLGSGLALGWPALLQTLRQRVQLTGAPLVDRGNATRTLPADEQSA